MTNETGKNGSRRDFVKKGALAAGGAAMAFQPRQALAAFGGEPAVTFPAGKLKELTKWPRYGAAEEEAFLTGDGTGKPTGLLHTTGSVQIGVTTAGATAITADELIDLIYSLKSPYRRNAVLIMNDSTIKAIRKLKDSQGQYLWQPSLVAGTPDTILSKRVVTSEYMPEVAAGAKSVVFGDLSYYWIADRQGRTFKRLNELFAATGQVGFLASQRLDGKLTLPEAIKVLQQKAA